MENKSQYPNTFLSESTQKMLLETAKWSKILAFFGFVIGAINVGFVVYAIVVEVSEWLTKGYIVDNQNLFEILTLLFTMLLPIVPSYFC